MAQTSGHVVQVELDSGTVTDLLADRRLPNLYRLVMLRHGVVAAGDNSPRLIADGTTSSLGAFPDG